MFCRLTSTAASSKFVRLVAALLGVNLEHPSLQHFLGLDTRHDENKLLRLAIHQPI